jgi:uncharacterized protein YdaU (DUF1376 family)
MTKKQINSFTFSIKDYDEATMGLTMMQDGAYFRLIKVYQKRCLPLPADMHTLYGLVGAVTAEEKAAVQFILKTYFTYDPKDEVFRQQRCDEDIAKVIKKTNGEPAKSTIIWRAYAEAWNKEYPHLDPLKNPGLQGNNQARSMITKLGFDKSLALAAWYPTYKADWWHTKNKHPFAALSKQAESLSNIMQEVQRGGTYVQQKTGPLSAVERAQAERDAFVRQREMDARARGHDHELLGPHDGVVSELVVTERAGDGAR